MPEPPVNEIDRRTTAGAEALDSCNQARQYLAGCSKIDFPLDHDTHHLVAAEILYRFARSVC